MTDQRKVLLFICLHTSPGADGRPRGGLHHSRVPLALVCLVVETPVRDPAESGEECGYGLQALILLSFDKKKKFFLYRSKSISTC